MIGRHLTLLFVVLTLANQGLCLARTPHGHHGGQPVDHDCRPHVHLGRHDHQDGQVGSNHGGPNHEGHQHGGHQHGGQSSSDASKAPSDSGTHVPASSPDCLPVDDHDSDAVYSGDSVNVARLETAAKVPAQELVANEGIALPPGCQADRLSHRLPSRPASSFFGHDECPIYLCALSLRL